MATIRQFRGSFSGGEVTPEFFGRLDDEKFQSGVAKLRNFLALPHGPARNRPGFRFVSEVRDSAQKTRLLRFTFSTTQTMVIEMGAGYFRFHADGATLVKDDGTPYEVANSYGEDDLFSVKYVQSGDILTLVHPNYPPMELRRYAALDWRFIPVSFTPPISAPTGVTVTRQNSSTTYTYSYVVTAISEDDWESAPSEEVSIQGNLYETGASNTVSWQAVKGAVKYKVYKKSSGVFGYIGVTKNLELKDDLITANTSKVPPEYDVTFSEAGNYPGAVTYFEQRRCFARTANSPQTLWMTKTGTESNMSMPVVTADDDAIEIRVATRDANTILHLVPLSSLVLLTSSAEMICTSNSSSAISQRNIMVKPQAYVGSSDVQPAIVNNIMLYVAARGNHVRELGYNYTANGFITGDLSLRAPHLFDGEQIVDMAFSASPYPVAWFVMNTGELLGLTYIPEENIGGWHVHETDGQFKSCCVVTENNDDRLYVIVEREINGEKKQYIECMSDMLFDDLSDAFFVDSGLTGEFDEPVTAVSGLDHLEGRTVSILADGAVYPQQVVTNGKIDLEVEARVVHVGLPIRSIFQTLPLLMQIDSAYGSARPKNINKCSLRVYRSSGIFVGFDEDHLREYKQRRDEQPGSPPEMRSEEVPVVIDGHWTDGGQLTVVQDDPLPLTIVSITTEVSIGG
jgi:hypothetical protein